MEMADVLRRMEENKIRALQGRATPSWGVLGYSELGERHNENMPTYANTQTPLQDPTTGKPYYMDGIDVLGDEDNAGLAPGS